MKSESKAFRERAKGCRDLADETTDELARRELRGVAEDLDDQAREIDIEDAAECNEKLKPKAKNRRS